MSQHSQKKSNAAVISEKAMSATQAGNMNTDQIRNTVALYTKRGSSNLFALITDTPMSIREKTVLALPAVNKADMSSQIVSINMIEHKSAVIPVVTYVGTLPSEANKAIALLAHTCASIRGGYFPGYASLSDTKTQVGGITAPAHFKNMIALNKRGSLLFSVDKTIQEISVADFLKQNWPAAKVINPLDSSVLFMGRPSEDEKNVFVVTEADILTVDIVSKRWSRIKKQPATLSEKAIAFFKDSKSMTSLFNDGSIERSVVAA